MLQNWYEIRNIQVGSPPIKISGVMERLNIALELIRERPSFLDELLQGYRQGLKNILDLLKDLTLKVNSYLWLFTASSTSLKCLTTR
jgi:hypothetical protein